MNVTGQVPREKPDLDTISQHVKELLVRTSFGSDNRPFLTNFKTHALCKKVL